MTYEQKEGICGFVIVSGAVGVELAMHDWRSALVLLAYFVGATLLADYAMSR